jgi:SAM-dependent methyltransferase
METLDGLYTTEIEERFGKSGERNVTLKEVIEYAKKLEGKKVWPRCVEYLEQHHPLLPSKNRTYRSDIELLLPPGYNEGRPIYQEILKSGRSVLEVGCFLGNNGWRLFKDNFKGRYTGIDINPWHLLFGFLLRNDSPDFSPNYRFYVGDVCDMKEFQGGQFDYIYSSGLIHSLVGKKSEHLEMVRAHLRESRRILEKGGKYFGYTFSSTEWTLNSSIKPLSEDELRSSFKDTGFENIRIEERRRLTRSDDKRKFFLHFCVI